MKRTRAVTLALTIAAALALGGLGATRAAAQAPDAKALFETKCSTCHSLERPTSKRKDRAGWEKTVARMKRNGCPISDEEAKTIVDYLTETYGK